MAGGRKRHDYWQIKTPRREGKQENQIRKKERDVLVGRRGIERPQKR